MLFLQNAPWEYIYICWLKQNQQCSGKQREWNFKVPYNIISILQVHTELTVSSREAGRRPWRSSTSCFHFLLSIIFWVCISFKWGTFSFRMQLCICDHKVSVSCSIVGLRCTAACDTKHSSPQSSIVPASSMLNANVIGLVISCASGNVFLPPPMAFLQKLYIRMSRLHWKPTIMI